MFRTEQRDEVDLGGLVKDVDDGAPAAVDAGGVGKQADALAAKGLVAAHGEHFVAEVNPGLGRVLAEDQQGQAQQGSHEAHGRS